MQNWVKYCTRNSRADSNRVTVPIRGITFIRLIRRKYGFMDKLSLLAIYFRVIKFKLIKKSEGTTSDVSAQAQYRISSYLTLQLMLIACIPS